MSYEIKLPELGEGITSGTVASLAIKSGEVVKEGDTILEIETDKAVLPVPSPITGMCSGLQIAEGDQIEVGQVIAMVDADGAAPEAAPGQENAAPEAPADEAKAAEEKTKSKPAAPAPAPAPAASGVQAVNLPSLGDGVESGTVASLLAKPGDALEEGDGIIEIETDKAVMPVPAPLAGKCVEILVEAGQVINVGQTIANLEASSTAAPAASAEPALAAAPEAPKTSASPASSKGDDIAMSAPAKGSTIIPVSKDKVVLAGPATRKLARELGIDLTQVTGSGKSERILPGDVKAYVKKLNESRATAGGANVAVSRLPDFSKFGPVRRESLSQLRKVISSRMTECWNRIPHVYQFQDIDVTQLARIQKTYSEDFKARGSSASPTNFIIKALSLCLSEFPQFNASLDEENSEVIYKEYNNIGVAVDTPAGLIVPVLKGVDKMSIFDIGKEIRALAKRTRDRKVMPDELQGASMTLSNLGGIGGTQFTPIVNWPEVAILGVGRTEIKPLYVEGKFVPRSVVQVCLSYDHRVIDGADGARFVTRLKEILENIERTILGYM